MDPLKLFIDYDEPKHLVGEDKVLFKSLKPLYHESGDNLGIIFSFLGASDIFRTIACVRKEFNEFVNSNTFIKQLLKSHSPFKHVFSEDCNMKAEYIGQYNLVKFHFQVFYLNKENQNRVRKEHFQYHNYHNNKLYLPETDFKIIGVWDLTTYEFSNLNIPIPKDLETSESGFLLIGDLLVIVNYKTRVLQTYSLKTEKWASEFNNIVDTKSFKNYCIQHDNNLCQITETENKKSSSLDIYNLEDGQKILHYPIDIEYKNIHSIDISQNLEIFGVLTTLDTLRNFKKYKIFKLNESSSEVNLFKEINIPRNEELANTIKFGNTFCVYKTVQLHKPMTLELYDGNEITVLGKIDNKVPFFINRDYTFVNFVEENELISFDLRNPLSRLHWTFDDNKVFDDLDYDGEILTRAVGTNITLFFKKNETSHDPLFGRHKLIKTCIDHNEFHFDSRIHWICRDQFKIIALGKEQAFVLDFTQGKNGLGDSRPNIEKKIDEYKKTEGFDDKIEELMETLYTNPTKKRKLNPLDPSH